MYVYIYIMYSEFTSLQILTLLTRLYCLLGWPEHLLSTYASNEAMHDHSMDNVDDFDETDDEKARAINMQPNSFRSLKSLLHKISIASMSTSFSGIDTPGTSMCVTLACLLSVFGLIKNSVPDHLFAIEWQSSCQDELQQHPCAANCIFGNIEDFVSPFMRRMLPNMHKMKQIKSVFLPLVKESARKLLTMYLGSG